MNKYFRVRLTIIAIVLAACVALMTSWVIKAVRINDAVTIIGKSNAQVALAYVRKEKLPFDELCITALRSRDDLVRLRTVWIIGELPDKDLVGPLCDLLLDHNEMIRSAARQSLMKCGTLVTPILLEKVAQLRDRDQYSTDLAMIMAHTRDTSAIHPLLYMLEHGTHNASRGTAACILGHFRDSRVVTALQSIVSSDTTVLLIDVIASVSLLRDTMSLPAVRKCAHARLSAIRAEAVQALGHLRDTASVPILFSMVSDSHVAVSFAAVTMLGLLDRVTCCRAIFDSAFSNANLMKHYGKEIDSLCVTCADVSDTVVLRAARSGNAAVRSKALSALFRVKHPRTAATLMQALDDTVYTARAAAFYSLEKLKVPQLKMLAKKKLASANLYDQRDAISVLGRLGDSTALVYLQKIVLTVPSPKAPFESTMVWHQAQIACSLLTHK